ncbi:MAG: phasin family protein [Rubrivivax sp.]
MATTKKKTASASQPAMELPSLGDLGQMIERFKLPGVDVKALIEWQRKDLETLAEANRQAYEGMKALAERRGEILRETLAQWQETLKDAAGKGSLSKQTEAAQRGMQQAIEHFRELAEMEAQTRSNAWKVLQTRMQENVANLQQMLQPKR